MLFPQCLHIMKTFPGSEFCFVFKLYPQLPADAPIFLIFYNTDAYMLWYYIVSNQYIYIGWFPQHNKKLLLMMCCLCILIIEFVKKPQYLPQIWRLCFADDDASEQVDLPVFSSFSAQIHLCWWGAAATQPWCHLSGQQPHLHLTTIALDPQSLWVQWARNDFWCLQEYENVFFTTSCWKSNHSFFFKVNW